MDLSIEIRRSGAGYTALFEDYKFCFSNISKSKFTALVKIVKNSKVLYIAETVLTDLDERWKIAQHLRTLQEGPWLEIVVLVFTKVLNELLKTEPAVKLEKVERQSAYFVYPLLAEPYSLIFAPGGSGKSYFSLLLALALQNQLDLGILKTQERINVLYLDWETSHQDMSRRFTLLVNGLGELESPFYRQMTSPLGFEFEIVLDDVINNDIKLVIIDSVVPAIGGEINHADKVGLFFQLLRELYRHGARILLLTHVNKQDKNADARSPIGSVFFENYPRLVWELKSISLTKRLQIDLVPAKYNVPKPPELSFVFEFEDDAVSIENVVANETADELKELILQECEKEGVVKIKDLIKLAIGALGVSENAVRKKIEDLKRAGLIETVEWGTIQLKPVAKDEPPF